MCYWYHYTPFVLYESECFAFIFFMDIYLSMEEIYIMLVQRNAYHVYMKMNYFLNIAVILVLVHIKAFRVGQYATHNRFPQFILSLKRFHVVKMYQSRTT